MASLPFLIESISWDNLTEHERDFFCEEDSLQTAHAKHINRLSKTHAKQFTTWALSALPLGWPDHSGFPVEKRLEIQHKWTEEKNIQDVRQWLFGLNIPFDRTVYLIYDLDCVVQTKWKILVKYWNQLAWSVGYAMTCVDHTQQWACTFHHEDVILFGRNHTH